MPDTDKPMTGKDIWAAIVNKLNPKDTPSNPEDRDIWNTVVDDWFGDKNNIAQLYEDSATHTANAADKYTTSITNAMRNYNTSVSNHRQQLGTALNATNAELDAGKTYLGNATQAYNNETDRYITGLNESRFKQDSVLDGLRRDIQNGTGMYAPTEYTLMGKKQSFLNKGARNTAAAIAELGQQGFDNASTYTTAATKGADSKFEGANKYATYVNDNANDKFKNWDSYATTSLDALGKLNTNANTVASNILDTTKLTDPTNASLATLAAYIKAANEEETRRQNDKNNAINAAKINISQQEVDNSEPGVLDWIKGIGSIGSSFGNISSWLTGS
jgi:hypothetical protein